MKRTAPFSKAAIRNACIAGIVGLAPIGLIAYGGAIQNTCVAGNPSYEAGTGLCISKNRANDTAVAKREAEELKLEAAKAKAAKEAADRKAAAEAKFKAEGWWEAQTGIFVRWCTNTCNNSKVIGDNRYSLMEVWAKDAHAGDIYAQVNLERNDVVIGWTNDTMYLSKGQRGVLTFDSYQYFDTARLTKFSARG